MIHTRSRVKIGDFEISWNRKNTTTFAIDEDSIHEAGCIHTSQGLDSIMLESSLGTICDMKTEWSLQILQKEPEQISL